MFTFLYLLIETVNAFVYIGFLASVFLILWWVIYLFFWKITISKNIITVKKLLLSKKEYNLQDITKADLRKENLILYVCNKKIAKIAYNCGSYPILIERLEIENIPFYEKGKLIEKGFQRTSRND